MKTFCAVFIDKQKKNLVKLTPPPEEALALIKAAAENRAKPSGPGIEVDITDLETKLTTTYDSIRKAANAINSDIKTILLVKNLFFFYRVPASEARLVAGTL